MPRIQPPERVGWLTRLAYRYAARQYGKVPEPLTIWAHAPAVFWSTSVYESLVTRTWKRLPGVIAELATLRAASVIGCPWCLDFGSLLATHGGVSREQVEQLHRWHDSGVFDDDQRAVLAYVDAATATPMTVDDAQVDHLREVLGTPALVELTALVALENQRSRFNHALGITAQGFSSDACALPSSAASSWTSTRPRV